MAIILVLLVAFQDSKAVSQLCWEFCRYVSFWEHAIQGHSCDPHPAPRERHTTRIPLIAMRITNAQQEKG
jgi:hypothetical protein